MGSGRDGTQSHDGGSVGASLNVDDQSFHYATVWVCEKWGEDKVDFARKELSKQGYKLLRDGSEIKGVEPLFHRLTDGQYEVCGEREIVVPKFITLEHGVPSEYLRQLGLEPDEIIEIAGNLLLNEGLQRLADLLIAAGGTAFNNASAYIGVGDTATAEAATQTELLATANAANRFYKAMVATYPQRPGSNGAQSVDWRSDFTTTEANFAWQEWTIAAGATTASGSGFLTGTTNLNRKVQSLGSKTTGTWTMTATVTFS